MSGCDDANQSISQHSDEFFPTVSPRTVVNISLGVVVAAIVWLFSAIDVEATAEIVTGPLLLIGLGLGLGGLASQLGSVTVSAVPDSQSPEVGGLQNTAGESTGRGRRTGHPGNRRRKRAGAGGRSPRHCWRLSRCSRFFALCFTSRIPTE